MLAQLFGFFKVAERREKSQQEVIPGTTLTYDPTLIKQLHSDHKELIELYGTIKKYLDKEDYNNVQKYLLQFSSLLRDHLLLENLKLYVYLTNALSHDAQNLEIMIDMRKEMGRIGRTVNQFLTRYTETLPWTEEKLYSFPNEFKQIGKVLVERINREENRLYTLYMPPSAYCNKMTD